MMNRVRFLSVVFLVFWGEVNLPAQTINFSKSDVLSVIQKVNNYWQSNNAYSQSFFWDKAAYHTGNMEAYQVTGNEVYRLYSENWAKYNNWIGAPQTNKSKWKYTYGEGGDYVLFGDNQICFQTYIDLYNIDIAKNLTPSPLKIARATEVMGYQITTKNKDYWWWADGLYMVMPVMTKMYKLTGNKTYLDKLFEYFSYADSVMYDPTEQIYYRDASYVYPTHTTLSGKKDFWSRGNGWVFAGLAKVLKDLPSDNSHRVLFEERFKNMAKALIKIQQTGGYWTRSLQDTAQAPGYETSGTAFFTYGLLWGINNGYLDRNTYLPAALNGWQYLTTIAMQSNGSIGYVQPIGSAAVPGQIITAANTANFGVGAFLLAASEMTRLNGLLSGVNNISINSNTIYPNPAKNNLTIRTSKIGGKCFIYDYTGREVKSFHITDYVMSLSITDLQPGIYLVTFANTTKKLVVY